MAIFASTGVKTVQDTTPSAMTARVELEEVNSDPVPVGISRARDGLFYAKANLGNGDARLLVDTGASHVVLSHSDAREAEIKHDPSQNFPLVSAAGPIPVDWVIIEELEVEGHVLKHVQAAVPRRDTGISLLGQNALAQFSSISIENDQLSLTP